MDKYVNFLLNIKLNELRRNHIESLTYQQLLGVLNQGKWLIARPTNLSAIARDINSVTIDEVVDFIAGDNTKLTEDFEKMSNELSEGLEEDNK